MNTDWSAENSVWANHCDLIDQLGDEVEAWRRLAAKQRKLVESYTERRRYPKRLNRNPGHHEQKQQERITEAWRLAHSSPGNLWLPPVGNNPRTHRDDDKRAERDNRSS